MPAAPPHPPHPDPGSIGVRFLAWLKKRGGQQRLTKCERKWQDLGLEVETTINDLGQDRIGIY